jgi:KDO2-lipid IV(A) lauroyltransferase
MFLYFLLLLPFSLLPASAAKFIGLRLGGLYFWIDKKHRKEVQERMNFCLGENASKNYLLTKQFYQYLGLLGIEIARMPFHHKKSIKNIVSDTNLKHFDEILKEGKGCIVVTGHFGNWEYAGMALAAYGYPVNAVAKPLKNQSMDHFFNRCRQKTGVKIIYQKNAYREMMRALKANEIVVMLLDYDTAPEKGGIFIPFFGKMAATIPTAAMLQLKTNAPIVVTRLKRDSDLIHSHAEIDQIINGSNLNHKSEKIFEISKKINESFERFILDNPPEWLWLTRRWRFTYDNSLPNENYVLPSE